jgi:hypothetical protein
MSMVRRSSGQEDPATEARGRIASMALVLICALLLAYVLFSGRPGPSRTGFALFLAGMLASNLRGFGGPRWLRSVALPIVSLLLMALAALVLFEANVL